MSRSAAPADLGAAVVSLVGTRGPMSRSALARQLRVSPATITGLTKTLIEQGTLTESGTSPSAGGRPAVLLDLTQRRRYALGAKITPNHVAMAEVDMVGDAQPATTVDIDMRAPEAIDRVVDAIARQVEGHADRLLGIGLAIPGFADPTNSHLASAPVLGWTQVNLGGRLQERTGLNVTIDNDVNALAITERLYGDNPTDNGLLITIGYGIGSAITVNGRVLRGSRGGAGELGHIVIEPNGRPCACGLAGCLETLIGDDALVARAVEAGVIRPGAGKSELNQAALQGNRAAQDFFRDAGNTLGTAAAQLVQVLDPDSISLSGEGVDMWPWWEPGFLSALRSHSAPSRRDIPVYTHPWTEADWAHGAASLVFASPLVPTAP